MSLGCQVTFLFITQSSEVALQQHVLEFEESKKQILEMEDKGYLSSDGFEGTLKVKTTELEPKLMAVEKQFTDTKNRYVYIYIYIYMYNWLMTRR